MRKGRQQTTGTRRGGGAGRGNIGEERRRRQVAECETRLMAKHALGHGESIDLNTTREWKDELWRTDYVDVERSALKLKPGVPSLFFATEEDQGRWNKNIGVFNHYMGERRRVIDKHVPQMAPDEAARRRQVALFRSADIHSTHERMEEHDVCASCAAHRAEAVVLARIAEARPGSLPMKPALWDARFDAVGAVLAGTTANAPVSTTRLAELSRGAASGPRDEDAGPSRGHHREGDVERGDDERELGRSVEAALQSFKWFSDFDAKIGGVYFSLVGKRLRLVDIIKAFSIEAGCVYVRWVSPDRDAPLHATLHFAVPHSIRLCVCVNVGLDRAPVAKTIAPHADRSRRKRSGPEPTAGEDAEKKASAPTPPPPPLSRDKGKEKADAPEGDGAAAAAAAAAAKLEAYVKTAVWQRQRELLGARPPTVHKGVGLPSQGRRRRADGLHYLAAMDERDMLRERLDEMPTEMLILDSEDVAMAQSIMYYTCMCV